MKICELCLRELFDYDTKCDVCGNKKLINNKTFIKISKELKNINSFQRKQLIKKYPYDIVYKYITAKKGLRYWKELKVKPSDKIIYAVNQETHQCIPKCPICQSTNIQKITVASKIANIALFGVFGNKRKHQWHCNQCGSDF